MEKTTEGRRGRLELDVWRNGTRMTRRRFGKYRGTLCDTEQAAGVESGSVCWTGQQRCAGNSAQETVIVRGVMGGAGVERRQWGCGGGGRVWRA